MLMAALVKHRCGSLCFRSLRRGASATANCWIDQEVKKYAEMSPHPVSLREILDCLEPWRAAKFLHSEVPIRFAERIRWIEELPHWSTNEELRNVHASHLHTFREILKVERHPHLDDFTAVVQDAVDRQAEVVASMAAAMHQMRTAHGEEYNEQFVNQFLDGFLLNRLGSNALMSQYLACVDKKRPATGIVDPRCDAASLCRSVATQILDITEEHTGKRPLIRVEAYSATGEEGEVPRFAYIPGLLTYIMSEILKNSCRATVEATTTKEELEARPITVVVCGDAHRMAIRVGDRARGIPFDVGTHVWSYLYSTARKDGSPASSLAGFGVGLPLSRLYARYLHGSLDLVSMPGYGTDAYLHLPRLESDQVEVVPDADHPFGFATLGDYAL